MALLSTEVVNYIQSEIALLDSQLFELQQSLWNNPEIAYQEHFAHATLTAFMSKQPQWEVTPSAHEIPTAFVAVFVHEPSSSTPTISFNAEYDALPTIGHACGHNLIATCGVTAAIATSLAMKKFGIRGTIKLMGTPAEERGGGKIKLINAGAYEGCDVNLMAHGNKAGPKAYSYTTAIQNFTVEYFGREAHAAASPWQGINALDALMVMYSAIGVLRQQLLPTDIVQCNIAEGGKAPNIITGYSRANFAVRAPTLARMRKVEAMIINCAKAGALATECQFKIEKLDCYYNSIPNDVLAERYREYMNCVYDGQVPEMEEGKKLGPSGASSDQGNVSWIMPSLQTLFLVKTDGSGPHTRAFAEAAGKPESHKSAIETGIVLSLMALELLKEPEILKSVKEQYNKDMEIANSQLAGVREEVMDLSILRQE